MSGVEFWLGAEPLGLVWREMAALYSDPLHAEVFPSCCIQWTMHFEGSELLPLSASASKKTRTLTKGCLRKSTNAALALDLHHVLSASRRPSALSGLPERS
jgi:hypothetical protein